MTNGAKKSTLFVGEAPRFYTIPAGRPFLGDLAQVLVQNFEPLQLAQSQIYLPTRRAMRTLAASIIDANSTKVSLLPKIRAIGTLDDDVILGEREAFDSLDVLPAISGIERKLILARFAAAKNRMFSGAQNWVAALGAASELEKLLDSFYTEEIDLVHLDALAPEVLELAAHWAESRKFLSILTENWPEILAERGQMDPAARRIALIRLTAAQWQTNPPQTPIILAGSTGSTPAVADLMKLVADLPNGCVILPGLDQELDDDAWNKIDDAHPQSGLKALLDHLKLSRNDIQQLPGTAHDGTGSAIKRQRLFSLALRPADRTDDWLRQIADIPRDDFAGAIEGLSLIVAHDDENEADIIALRIRQTLETPDDHVMLVTPDRNLARRVSAKLRRWSIETDDSAGVPLGNTGCGIFLRLVADWLVSPSDPVHLLAMLRHPLCTLQTDLPDFAKSMSQLDVALRGLKPSAGFEALAQRAEERCKTVEGIAPLVDRLRAILAGVDMNAQRFAQTLARHITIAESLTSINGRTHLWRGEDGITASHHLQQLQAIAGHLESTEYSEYPALFSRLLAGVSVRRQRAVHPRVHILGPLEARLHSANHIILGGLNEGVWPGDAITDGFLSRPMRKKIGLPSPERRTGLSAHDFAQLAAQPRVTMTRAARTGNAPSTASRWIIRLRNILKAFADKNDDSLRGVDQSQYWQTIAKSLDQTQTVEPVSAPAPKPPLSARPREIYVTGVENWLRDPYSIYAKSVLRLRKLNPFNEQFDARHIGIAIHEAFEGYTNEVNAVGVGDIARLKELFAHSLSKQELPAHVLAIWAPAFDKSLDWFCAWHTARLGEGQPVVVENVGRWTFDVDGNPFTLSARADRIDLLSPQGQGNTGLAIYDYKTGTLPSLKQQQTFSPQLALTALIAMNGGFEAVGALPVFRQAFVKSFGRQSSDPDFASQDTKIVEGQDSIEMMQKAELHLRQLIALFDQPETPYLSQPRPEYLNKYGDFDHLARRREWAGENDDDDTREGEL